MTRFDVEENEKIIDREDEKDEINDRVFDCDADFRLSDDFIDSNEIKDEIKEINELEIIDFDFFA